MKENRSKSRQSRELRSQAEELLNNNPTAIKTIPHRDVRNLIEDLQVHHTKLEIQNEELRKVKMELKEMRNKYLEYFDLASIGYVLLDKKGCIRDANLFFANQLGVKRRRHLIGKALPSFLAPKNRDALYFHLKRVFETGARQTCELKFVKKDGAEFYAQLESIVVQNDVGDISRCRIFINDVTERVRTQERLLEYQKAVEGSEDLITAVDRRYFYTLANEAFLRYHCLSRDQVIGHSIQEVMGEEVFESMIRPNADRCIKGEPVDYQMKYHYPEYGELCLLVSHYPLKGGDGEVTGEVIVTRDITVPKMAAEGLRESEERYRLLAENVTDIIWTMDMNMRFNYVSPSVERLRGYTPEEALAQTLEESMTPASSAKAVELFKEELRKHNKGQRDPKMPVTVELEFTHKDGSTIWTECEANLTYDSAGRPTGIIGTTRDIRKRKQLEEALRETEQKYRSMKEPMIEPVEDRISMKTLDKIDILKIQWE